MIKKKILIITGEKFSGKDTLSKPLLDNYNFERRSFSDFHKELSRQIFPWLELDYPSDRKEVPLDNGYTKLSPREIWETVDKLRVVDPYIHARRMYRELSDEIFAETSSGDLPQHIIITDLRTKEEYELMRLLQQTYYSDIDMKFVRISSSRTSKSSIVERDLLLFPVDSEYFNQKTSDDFKKFHDLVVSLFGSLE